MESTSTFDLIVVGGGIAGISVVEQVSILEKKIILELPNSLQKKNWLLQTGSQAWLQTRAPDWPSINL